jgi:hypothetical protein
MIIDLIFSQANMSYYYYENGKGYTYEDYKKQIQLGGDSFEGGTGSSFYYDDGIYMAGYTAIDSANGNGNSSNNSSGGSGSSSSGGSSSGSSIDDSALKG